MGAVLTAFLTDCTFPLEITHTVQKSGAPLEMLAGMSEVLNLQSVKETQLLQSILLSYVS